MLKVHTQKSFLGLKFGTFVAFSDMLLMSLMSSCICPSKDQMKAVILVGNGPSCPLEKVRGHFEAKDMSRTCILKVPGHLRLYMVNCPTSSISSETAS